MSERLVFERRAATVLRHYLRSVARPGAWLLPANVCPIVPAVFSSAKIAYELVDIEPSTLCLDSALALSRLRQAPSSYAGVLFVRTYGHSGNFEPFFRKVKQLDSNLRIIDDRCLARPFFAHSGGVADLELYSTGYSKFVELGWGGWGILSNGQEYLATETPFLRSAHDNLVVQFRRIAHEHLAFSCPSTPWLDTGETYASVEEFRSLVTERTAESARHRASLNAIYKEQLGDWAAPPECLDWRFTVFCDCQEELLQSIFNAGHFASAHFASLAPQFGPGTVPVADAFGRHAVNLFNDFRYDEYRARHLAKAVRSLLLAWSPRDAGRAHCSGSAMKSILIRVQAIFILR